MRPPFASHRSSILKRVLQWSYRFVVAAVFVAWALLITLVTQIPFEYQFSRRKLLRLPFLFGFGSGPGWEEPFANFLMFVPFGLLLALLIGWRMDGAARVRTPSAKRPMPRRMIGLVTVIGASFSLLIESLQAFQSDRHASFVDLALNTGGAYAGAMIVALVLMLIHARRSA